MNWLSCKSIRPAADGPPRRIFRRAKSALAAITFVATAVLCAAPLQAQSTDDYRSKTSAIFAATSTWEWFNGTSWNAATMTPTSSKGAINVRSPHAIAIAGPVTVDQLTIDSGGQVTINPNQTLTLANGAGFDLTVAGTLLNRGNSLAFSSSSATWTVLSGGTYVHNTPQGVATPLNQLTLASGSTFIYRGSSGVTPPISVSGRTYSNLVLESTGDDLALNPSGTNTLTTDDFTVGSKVAFNYTGGVTSNGNVTVNGSWGGQTAIKSLSIASGKTLAVGSTGSVDVAAGETITVGAATFAGTGTVRGSVTLKNGATLAPGDTGVTGTLRAAYGSGKTLTFESGSTYEWEFASAGTGQTSAALATAANVAGDYDRLDLGAGTLHLAGGVATVILTKIGAVPFDKTKFYRWTIALADALTGPGQLLLDGSALAGAGDGTFGTSFSGGVFSGTYSPIAVPEPTGPICLVLPLAAWALRRRRSLQTPATPTV